MVESAAGGLVCAALLAVPGASAYCRGGIVVYTGQAWKALRDFDEALLEGHRSATEGNARVPRSPGERPLPTRAGVSGETGAAGPTANRYGDPAGHAWVAVSDLASARYGSIPKTSIGSRTCALSRHRRWSFSRKL